MSTGREALVVAVDDYADAGFNRLRAPRQDAERLADVLGDPRVGDFEVTVLRNAEAQRIRVAVEDFFADRRPDDLLLLHFSCHGVKSASGELFLAAADSRPGRLASTAIAADFVNRQMADCRAQRIALFLDCCYGGAFPRGMVMRGTSDVGVRDTFADQEAAGGRGRVVVTASSAVEYAFEGGELAADAQVSPSVFTGSVVEGLATGEADRDGDGWVGLNELFGYVAERVRRVTPNQTPHLWAFGSEGDLLLARSRRRRVVATALPTELAEGVVAPLAATRYGVAVELRDRLAGADLGQALAAYQALLTLTADDSRRVSELATDAVASAALRVAPSELVVGPDAADPTRASSLRLIGPPLALAANADVSAGWLTAEVTDDRLDVRVTAPQLEGAGAVVTITTPTGVAEVPVRVGSGAPADHVPGGDVPEPGHPAPLPAVAATATGSTALATGSTAPAADAPPPSPEAAAASGPRWFAGRWGFAWPTSLAVLAVVAWLGYGYARLDEYVRMPSGYSDLGGSLLVDGYSTALTALVGAVVVAALRPAWVVSAAGVVAGSALWLVLLAAVQLTNPAVSSGTSERRTWSSTLYLGLGLVGLALVELARHDALTGAVHRRRPSRAETVLLAVGAVLLGLAAALDVGGAPVAAQAGGLALLSLVVEVVLVGLVCLTSIGRSRGDALVAATLAYLGLEAVLMLFLGVHTDAPFARPGVAGTAALAVVLALRRRAEVTR